MSDFVRLVVVNVGGVVAHLKSFRERPECAAWAWLGGLGAGEVARAPSVIRLDS